MTSTTRRALPWALSLGAHLAALALIAILIGLPAPPIPIPILEVSLVGPSDSSTMPGARAGRGIISRLPAGRSAPNATPGPATPVTSAVRPGSAPSDAQAAGMHPVSPDTWTPSPTERDVLADARKTTGSSTEPPGVSPTLVAPGTGPGPTLENAQWRWQSVTRQLIRRRDPGFPTLLSAMGQEIEAEARITVAPSGKVTRVEITRSSGYIEIDASVKDALRDYLFSRVDGSTDTVGTVRFRFRLEKQD
jgi:TonB family protein